MFKNLLLFTLPFSFLTAMASQEDLVPTSVAVSSRSVPTNNEISIKDINTISNFILGTKNPVYRDYYMIFKKQFNMTTGESSYDDFFYFVVVIEKIFNSRQAELCNHLRRERNISWKTKYAKEIYPEKLKNEFETFQKITNKVFSYWKERNLYQINDVYGVIKRHGFPKPLAYISDSNGYIPTSFLGDVYKNLDNEQHIQYISYGGDFALKEGTAIFTVYNGQIMTNSGYYVRKNENYEITYCGGVNQEVPFYSNDIWLRRTKEGDLNINLGAQNEIFIPTTFESEEEILIFKSLLAEELAKNKNYKMLSYLLEEGLLEAQFTTLDTISQEDEIAGHSILQENSKNELSLKNNLLEQIKREQEVIKQRVINGFGSLNDKSNAEKKKSSKKAQTSSKKNGSVTKKQKPVNFEQKYEEFRQDTRIKYRHLLSILSSVAKSANLEDVKIFTSGSHFMLHGKDGAKGVTFVRPHGSNDTTLSPKTSNSIIKKFIDFAFSQAFSQIENGY